MYLYLREVEIVGFDNDGKLFVRANVPTGIPERIANWLLARYMNQRLKDMWVQMVRLNPS
jgi:hypothetical protein